MSAKPRSESDIWKREVKMLEGEVAEIPDRLEEYEQALAHARKMVVLHSEKP